VQYTGVRTLLASTQLLHSSVTCMPRSLCCATGSLRACSVRGCVLGRKLALSLHLDWQCRAWAVAFELLDRRTRPQA
jgi:hypothetical protein